MLLVAFSAVDVVAVLGLVIQNKAQGVKITQETILHDDPTGFRVVLVVLILTFYLVTSFFAF